MGAGDHATSAGMATTVTTSATSSARIDDCIVLDAFEKGQDGRTVVRSEILFDYLCSLLADG